MRKLLFIVIILSNHNQQVNSSSVFEYMYEKLIGIKDSIVDSFGVANKNLKNVVHRTFSQEVQETTTKSRQNRDILSSFTSEPDKITKYDRPDMKFLCTWTEHSFTTPQLSATDGRIMETHITHTLDGYILTLHRLYSRRTDHRIEKRTILFHHGLLGSSADWILLGPKKSLPYILYNAGHDVWLANSRGNYYSRTHLSMSSDSEKYWNFSWQEIGEYDLPATLDYIRKTKNSTEPIDYIGHSMGATALLVLLSVKSYYNSYFRIAILLAPLVHMTNTRGPLRMLAKMKDIELVRVLGTGEYMRGRRTSLSLSMKMCRGYEDYCNNPLFFLTGSPLQNSTRTTEFKQKLQKYVPAGGSTKTIRHYLDVMNNKQFHHYGKPDRKFEIQFINTPILIISSNDDTVSNVTDNQVLYLSLQNPVGHIIIEDKNVSHTEFVWGFNTEVLFYYKIRDVIDVGPYINEIF